MLSYFWGYMQYILMILCSFLYPLYRSSRIFKQKESKVNLKVILKYWVLYAFLYFIDQYLKYFIVSFITFYDFLQLVIFVALVVDNFRLSVMIYDILINPFFLVNQDLIDSQLKIMNDKISERKDQAIESGRSFISQFLRETLLPMISSIMFTNPQEPKNEPRVAEENKMSYNNPVNEDSNE